MKVAVVFVSHFISDSYLQRYHKLCRDLEGQYDVYWLFQTDNGISKDPLLCQGVNLEEFTIADLNALNYSPISEYFFGSEHFLDELFFHRHPDYDYLWSIEYDVVFTGNWNVLFDAFSQNDADMLSAHIAKFETCPSWNWWPSLTFNSADWLPSEKWVKSFNPIHRYSKKALHFLDTFLQHDGNSGFSEALVATVLYNNGYRLEDFGGEGSFVAPVNRDRFYLQLPGIHIGTLRWRPEYTIEELAKTAIPNHLFHPVK